MSESFAGHIKDFKHTTASSSVPVEVAHSVNSSVNVDLTTCLEEVSKLNIYFRFLFVFSTNFIIFISFFFYFLFMFSHLLGFVTIFVLPLYETPLDHSSFGLLKITLQELCQDLQTNEFLQNK